MMSYIYFVFAGIYVVTLKQIQIEIIEDTKVDDIEDLKLKTKESELRKELIEPMDGMETAERLYVE